jgi:hypothetical protein
LYLYVLRAVEDAPCSSTRSIRICTPYAISCTEGILVLTSNSGNSARSQLIKTRRGTWIDESLLPAARRECLGVLREAARKGAGEATYLPGWISDATDSVEWDLTDLSRERLEWKPTPAEEEMKDEVYATIDALEDRGAFEGLGFLERMDFQFHVEHRIRSKHKSRISNEAEEARKKRRWPKSNPTLVTEKDTLNSVLDVIHRHGVLDEIDAADFLRAAMEEDAQDLAREARKTPRCAAVVAGSCLPRNPRTLGRRSTSACGLSIGIGYASRRSASSATNARCCANRVHRIGCRRREMTW